MTTFLYHDGCFYSDTRAYVNGQPFNISGKIVALTEPIAMKATLDKGSAKPIELDDTIYGYFITHAVEPGRALFNALLESAKQQNGDVQNVVDNHQMFIEVFKLAAFSSHFSLILIGGKGTYVLSTPAAIDREYQYQFSPYVTEASESSSGGVMMISYGANFEVMSAMLQAHMPVIIAYYTLFLQYIESGGNVESWRLRKLHGKMYLLRDSIFPEVTPEKMRKAIAAWQVDPNKVPICEMSAIYSYGPDLLSEMRLEKHLENQGFAFVRDENKIISHLVPAVGKVIDIREPRARAKSSKKSTK